MSPITAVARERLEQDVLKWLIPVSAPAAIPAMKALLRMLTDDLIQAVRAEWPSDSPF